MRWERAELSYFPRVGNGTHFSPQVLDSDEHQTIGFELRQNGGDNGFFDCRVGRIFFGIPLEQFSHLVVDRFYESGFQGFISHRSNSGNIERNVASTALGGNDASITVVT